MQSFVHLHVHSQYSLLDGQSSIKGLIDKALKDNMPGIALTDHGAMFGIKDFYNSVKKVNAPIEKELKTLSKELKSLEEKSDRTEEEQERISAIIEEMKTAENKRFKGILGCEAYCARRSRHKKDPNAADPYKPKRSIDSSGWHIVLLAKNKKGYQNLIKMISLGWTEGYYYRPRIDKELLERYHEGIIVSTACLGGEIPQHLLAGEIEEAEKSIQWFKSIFGEDFYLEVQRHETHNPLANQTIYPEQVKVNNLILELGKKHNVKVIATNDVHFINEEDAEAHDRLICLSTSKSPDDPNRMRYSKQEWLKTTEEMNKIFQDIPEVLANTMEIWEKIESYSIDNEPLMPDFPIPSGFEDDNAYLRHLTYLGAEKKYGKEGLTEIVRERIDFELDTIKSMGFPGYFLIVQDFIAAARDLGVFVGPGRGSAAGSAVAYCLNITNIDPIKYDLLFERFLNPDRISMPDIDIDFDDDGRADVLNWVTEKYGKERVAHIITYGTMASKSALKDVARVEGLPLSDSNRLAKLIPDKLKNGKKTNLRDAIQEIPELREASLSHDKKLSDTLKYAQQLEGSVRNTGVHACGIIIGKTDISDIVPISTVEDKSSKGENGERNHLLVTQYEGSVIEETGLIKMDFLGLKTLSVIKETLKNIKQSQGIDIDIEAIPIDDPKTYELYSMGRTVGTFQFESPGMQKYLRELKPSTFEDLIAMNALYRPGPMEYIPQFVRRKHGQEAINYDLPCMERYLKDTYGITVYQEQVMLLSREIADFTRGESDTLRKAMGKKQIDKMNALKVKFIEGGKKNSYDEKTLNKIWQDWEEFAKYAFNKSHSTCYSWVAYQTAYLKANYPAEYMAGALSRNLDNITEITKLMTECKAMGIRVLVPDVNESNYKFGVNKNNDIRFGLSAIKGVGMNAAQMIIEEREKNGLFKDIFDFFERINTRSANKKTLEGLALSGGFDAFGIPREAYFETAEGQQETLLESLIRYSINFQQEKLNQENSLFGFDDEGMQLPHPPLPSLQRDYPILERLRRERELVGIYLSDHPLGSYRMILEELFNADTEVLNSSDELPRGKKLEFGGMVTKAQERLSKKGSPYGDMTIEDAKGSYQIRMFGENYMRFASFFREGLILYFKGSIEPRGFYGDESLELKINDIQLLSEVKDQLIKKIMLSFDPLTLDAMTISELETLLCAIANKEGVPLELTIYDSSSGTPLPLSSTDFRIEPHATELIDFCHEHEIDLKPQRAL